MQAQEQKSFVVRFAGDSGDGVQLTGHQLTMEAALSGQDLATFPDFPAEIRAPAGTTFGVSAFQIHFGSHEINTAGDDLDVLIAFNPAALKTNLADLKPHGLLIVDSGAFGARNLKKAGYPTSPLEDGSLDPYTSVVVNITRLTQAAVEHCGVSNRESSRSKNFWVLGFVLWLCGHDRAPTRAWIDSKFASTPKVLAANHAAMDAGHVYAESVEWPNHAGALGPHSYRLGPAPQPPGEYRSINGADALSLGLVSASNVSGRPLVYCSYPITPASSMLHALVRMGDYGVQTFQAEDELAAVCAAIGASYGGALAVTGTSGPGMALKTEAIGLAISAELPLIVVNAQRGGPSTGLPTKTEQSDLLQALWGRNGDSPLAVIAARSPSDCFDVAIEAAKMAIEHMTPVILLTDGYLANAAEPWRIPKACDLPTIATSPLPDPASFRPFDRDAETLARPWAVPGTPGYAHRIGGLEKAHGSGDVSYDPDNHSHMTTLRAEKIARIAKRLPRQEIEIGEDAGPLLVVGWGSTYGAILEAVRQCRLAGDPVSFTHLRYLSPLPSNFREILDRFDRVLVPELNMGQLKIYLQASFARPVHGLSKVSGKPFRVTELVERITHELMELGVSYAAE